MTARVTPSFQIGRKSYCLCVMTTVSMEPAVGRGDVLLVETPVEGKLAPGDLLLLDGGGERPNVVHRLIKTTILGGRRCVVTKGDFILGLDEPRSVEQVLGRAAFIQRPGQAWRSLDVWWARALARLGAPLLALAVHPAWREAPGRLLGRLPCRRLRVSWLLAAESASRRCNDLLGRWLRECAGRPPKTLEVIPKPLRTL